MTIKQAFEILGLGEDAARGDLKRAFGKAAKKSHPDKTRRKDTGAFREAREAYDLLLPILPKKRKPVADDPRTPETPPPPPVQATGPAGPASTIYKQAAYLKGNYRTNPGIYKQATPPARPTPSRVPARP